MSSERKTLRGDRNQCHGCRQYFNSTSAFDKHREGTHGVDRHCLTVDQMVAKGMALNLDGFWVGAPWVNHNFPTTNS